MKKLLFYIVTMMLPIAASADAVEIDGIYYDLVHETKSAEVSSNPNKYEGNVKIPEKVYYDGIAYNVTAIESYAFSSCANLTSIDIPNSVKTIGEQAFRASGLLSIIIPNNVTTIKDWAFYECTNLTTAVIGNNVSNFGSYIFRDCSNLISVTILDGVTMIGSGAFMNCKSLITATIPNSVTSIGGSAFSGCSGLISVYIGNSVKSIGAQAFSGCGSITSVHISDIEAWCKIDFNVEWIDYNNGKLSNPLTIAKHLYVNDQEITELEIPNSITSINDGVFYGWENLIAVTIPSSVISIGQYAFGYCGFTSINIPNSVKTIDNSAFIYCTKLSSVIIGNGVTSINKQAFHGCISLSSIVIPNSVTSIGDEVFSGCINLSDIVIPDGLTIIPYRAFYRCITLKSITLPNQLIAIKDQAFRYCYDLEAITIPYSTQVIYQQAFQDCSSLNKIIALPITPPFLYDNSFSNFSVPLKVPKGCKEAYQTAQGWKNFVNISDADKYNLTYVVDADEYKSYEIEEGTSITPEPAPTKDGYTFSGWSEIPETMPAHDVTVTGTFAINKYKLTYMIDGAEYKSYELEYGATITPETAPTKEGYTFSGWGEIPETMPAHDLTVTGSFTVNKYKLIYKIDDADYKSYELEYGTKITPEQAPTKEGYTFSGWSEIPETMPAHDVTVTGIFSINKYKLTYTVNGEEYKSYELDYGASITPEAAPTKEGYTFSGWSEIPETMPANDLTVTGSFTINSYKLTYMIDNKVYKEIMYEYGATITPELQPEGDYATFEWTGLPQTMPAHDVVVYASYTSGISEVLMKTQRNIRIYSPNGKKLDKQQKGLNIVVLDDGTVKKVVIK